MLAHLRLMQKGYWQ
ncbi:TPA: hypothetical protein ACWSD3_005417 [Escherichia coli]